MPLQPVTFERFGGLDLRPAPNETAGAVDLLNVTFTDDGAVRSRDGSAVLTQAATGIPRSLGAFYTTAGLRQLLYSDTLHTYAVDASGALVASTGMVVASAAFVRIGTPTAETMYVIGSNSVRKWDGASFSTPVAPTQGLTAAATPTDNRLAIGAPGTNLSRVVFSDPGAPEVFGVNNFVDLQPGDGETVQSMVTWRDQLFVFKESKFFVFYGTSTAASGDPVFNYRPVVGAGVVGPQAACVARDAVYFISKDGVYRTTGGPPERISDQITALFQTSGGAEFWQLGRISRQAWTMASITALDDRLYLFVPMTPSDATTMFVYDLRQRWWTVHRFAGVVSNVNLCVGTFEVVANTPEIVFGGRYGVGDGRIFRHNPSFTDDYGTAITSRYRAGFNDYGVPGEKTARETLLEGNGTVTWQWSRDWGSLQAGDTVALGASLAEGRSRRAFRGRMLSWQASGSSPWKLERVVPLLRGSRQPGAMTHA